LYIKYECNISLYGHKISKEVTRAKKKLEGSNEMKKEDILIVKGATFWATHGYYQEENKFGQKFIVDVEVNVDCFFLVLMRY